MLAVFDDVGNPGIAAAVSSWLRETHLDIVVTVPVQLCRRQTQRPLQLTSAFGRVFCILADRTCEIALDAGQQNFTACLQHLFCNLIGFCAQLR